MFYKHLHGLRGLASLMVFLVHITDGYNMHVSNIFGRPEEIGTFQYYISNVGNSANYLSSYQDNGDSSQCNIIYNK